VRARVAIVGGGVTGLASARALARRGADVTLYEQFTIGNDRGSSHGTSRIFRVSYPEARWVRLVLEALPLWRELEEECGETLLQPAGTLDLRPPKENIAALAEAGARHELLEPDEIERRWPLRADGERGLYQPDGAVIHAARAVAALRAGAEAAGARILEGMRVESVDELDADAVLVTAGGWAPRLADLDVEPTAQTVAYAAFAESGYPSVMDWMWSGDERVFYGLAAPGVGVKGGLHKSGAPVDPDQPAEPDPELLEWAGSWLLHRFVGASEPVTGETCIYTNAENDDFVCEARGTLVVGSACSGHGFKFAPLLGERLADLALSGRGLALRE
jgi:sarcosine oxidase